VAAVRVRDDVTKIREVVFLVPGRAIPALVFVGGHEQAMSSSWWPRSRRRQHLLSRKNEEVKEATRREAERSSSHHPLHQPSAFRILRFTIDMHHVMPLTWPRHAPPSQNSLRVRVEYRYEVASRIRKVSYVTPYSKQNLPVKHSVCN
jgi:hypothetical protein